MKAFFLSFFFLSAALTINAQREPRLGRAAEEVDAPKRLTRWGRISNMTPIAANNSLAAIPAARRLSGEPLRAAPAGKRTADGFRFGVYYYMYNGSIYYYRSSSTSAVADYVVADSKVYLKNPISAVGTAALGIGFGQNNWMRLDLYRTADDDGGEVYRGEPQAILTVNGESYYAKKFVWDDSRGRYGEDRIERYDNNRALFEEMKDAVFFRYDAESGDICQMSWDERQQALTLGSQEGKEMLGLTDRAGQDWYGYGDYDIEYRHNDLSDYKASSDDVSRYGGHTPLFNEYVMRYYLRYDSQTTFPDYHIVNLGLAGQPTGSLALVGSLYSGSDGLLSGFREYNDSDAINPLQSVLRVPSGAVCWRRLFLYGDTATLGETQYIGADTLLGVHIFADSYETGYERIKTKIKNSVWGYDGDNLKDVSLESECILALSNQRGGARDASFGSDIIALYDSPTITRYTEDAGTPLNAVFLPDESEEYSESLGLGSVAFLLPKLNIRRHPLRADSIYYSIYTDSGKLSLAPPVYKALNGEMTDIPYNFTDSYDILVGGPFHRVYYYDPAISNIGVRSVYVFKGKKFYSDIVWMRGAPTALRRADGHGVKEAYKKRVTTTDISGRPSAAGNRGPVVRVTVMSDCSRKSEKVVAR